MSKQHPNHDRIVAMVLEGKSNHGIHAELGGCRKAIARIRREVGVDTFSRTVPVAEQLKAKVAPADADGHQLWTGALTSGGVPRMRVDKADVPVSHVIFEQRTGRQPVGQVRPDCGVKGCVAPGHLLDDTERRAVRMMTRVMLDMPGPWSECRRCGGDWDTFGRVDDKLRLYCTRCTADRAQRNRKKGREA